METSSLNLAYLRIILMYDVCALVAKGLQMLATGMFKSLEEGFVRLGPNDFRLGPNVPASGLRCSCRLG